MSSFQSSIREELIGVDDLLPEFKDDAESDPVSGETAASSLTVPHAKGEVFDRGESAVEYTESELVSEDADVTVEQMDPTKGEHNIPNTAVSLGGLNGAENISCKFDSLFVRVLPPYLAPRCLNDFDEATSPNIDLLQAVMIQMSRPNTFHGATASRLEDGDNHVRERRAQRQELTPFSVHRDGWQPGAAPKAPAAPTLHGVWRWVTVDTLYKNLSAEQKQCVKEFKGLVIFLRLHGRLFEVSADKRYVIRHDTTGVLIPPLIPSQTVFLYEDRVVLPPSFHKEPNALNDSSFVPQLLGDDLRDKYETVLCGAQFPTNRTQLLLLDPNNPILDSIAFVEEIAEFLPDHPVSLQQLGTRLPPILRAAMPHHFKRVLTTSPAVTVFQEGGRLMISKKKVAPQVPRGSTYGDTMSMEEAIAAVRSLIQVGGTSAGQIANVLSPGAKLTILKKYRVFSDFILANPQFFKIDSVEIESRNGQVKRVELIHNVRGNGG